jgi:hypothetical protein
VRVRSGVALILLARLALATVAIAQVVDEESEPPRPPVPARVEIGVTAGATIGLPELGLIGSVPLDGGASLDVLVAHMPRVWDGTSHVLGQAQFRLPFRAELRSRRSVVFGVTRIGAGGGRRFLGDFATFTRPHAGVSLQWPISRGADVRVDAQGILTFAGDLPMLPRAMVAIVWHSKPGPRAARRPARGRS